MPVRRSGYRRYCPSRLAGVTRAPFFTGIAFGLVLQTKKNASSMVVINQSPIGQLSVALTEKLTS